MRPFWQGCWLARSVLVVEVNGYTIEPRADLEGADLEGANLSGANLKGVYLGGVNLEGAVLDRVDLAGAKAKKSTVWPEGFDPVAARVIFED